MKKAIIGCLSVLMSATVSLSYAAATNSALQGFHQDMQSQMEKDEPLMLPSVEVLWRSALTRSATLQLALQKIGQKTGTIKDKKAWTNQLLSAIVQAGGMGGSIITGNAAPMIGASVFNRVSTPDRTPERLTAVTSADMVILAREVEHTQTQLVVNYLRYRQARETLGKLQTQQQDLENDVKLLPSDSPQLSGATRSLLLQGTIEQQKAQDNLATIRNVIVLSCGEEALAEADKLADNAVKEPSPDSALTPVSLNTTSKKSK